MANYPDVKTEIVNGVTETDGNQVNDIEDYVGTRTDPDPTTITYKLTNPLSVGPGHKHPAADMDGGADGALFFKDPADHIWKQWLPDTIGLVTKLGEQTIAAKKTFSVLPESASDPSTDAQFARRKFVMDQDIIAIAAAVAAMATKYGEMYNYQNSDKLLLDEADVYNGVIVKTAGLLDGFTFQLGKTAVCTTFATYEGGAATLITSDAHALTTGEVITISNSAHYNGKHVVTFVGDNTFSIPVAYSAEAGGAKWIRPSYLKVATGAAGTFRVNFSSTINCDAGKTYRVQLSYVHATTIHELENIASELKKANADNNGAVSAAGFVELSDGDMIFVTVKNLESTADATVRYCNLNLTRVKRAV